MPIADAIPTIVAARLTRHLEHNAVYAPRVNSNYTAEARVGNTVNILPRQAVSVTAYNPANTTALAYAEQAPGTAIALVMDQFRSWSIKLEDVYSRQAVPDILASGIEVAGAALAEVIDEYVRDQMHTLTSRSLNVGASGSKVDFAAALTAPNKLAIKQAFRAAARRMTSDKIPLAGRWAIVGPVMMTALTELFEEGQLGDATLQDTVRNGFRGQLYGLSIYETSNPVSATAQEGYLFGNDYGYAFIQQMDNVERLRLTDRHADAIRGLAVYGGKYIEQKGFFEGTLHYENLPNFA